MSESTIIFYGKNFTPLSNECYGCYHYGSICSGSVYEGECRAGVVENMKPSIIAELILKHSSNRFTLARCFGYNLQEDVKDEDLKTEELKQEFNLAVSTPEDVITLYKEMFSLDIHSKVIQQDDIVEQNHFTPSSTQVSESDHSIDPFMDSDNFIDVSDKDLPF